MSDMSIVILVLGILLILETATIIQTKLKKVKPKREEVIKLVKEVKELDPTARVYGNEQGGYYIILGDSIFGDLSSFKDYIKMYNEGK